MKKPGKPKPKRRGRPKVVAEQPSAIAVARAGSVPSMRAKGQALPAGRSFGARAFGLWSDDRDDRMALTLLLLPVILVAAWLTLNPARRADRTWGGSVATYAPSAPPRLAAAPASTLLPMSKPQAARINPSLAVPPQQSPVAGTRLPTPAATSPRPSETARAPLPASPPPVSALDAVRANPPAAAAPSVEPDLPPVPATKPPLAPASPPARTAALDPGPSVLLHARPDGSPADPSVRPADDMPPQVGAGQVCAASDAQLVSFASVGRFARAQLRPRLTGIDAATFGYRLAAAAIAQTRDLVFYSARYQPMAYPMGDVVAMQGACIDVVIRAYRELGIDLQEEVQRGRPSRGDTNIDHRRTENMRRLLERSGASLPVTAFPEDYKPGDIVTYHRPFSRVSTSHIAVVTGVLAATGRPMIVHNRGYGAQLEDALFVDRITGHYRYLGGPSSSSSSSAARIGGPPGSTPSKSTAHTVVRASLPAGTLARSRSERPGQSDGAN